MANAARKEPSFALCGLNCCLCPRFNTTGKSRCPGCGGPDFREKHPSCAVMTCNGKHDNVEFCFQCGEYPCERYRTPQKWDSFISYRNVLANLAGAGLDLAAYREELRLRKEWLDALLNGFDDGRRKSLFCLAANDLPPERLAGIMSELESLEGLEKLPIGEKSRTAAEVIAAAARAAGMFLELRRREAGPLPR